MNNTETKNMTAAEIVALVRAQGKTEKPTKGMGEWTRDPVMAEAMAALGFTVVYVPEPGNGTAPCWRLNCNGNRFHALVKLVQAAGGRGK